MFDSEINERERVAGGPRVHARAWPEVPCWHSLWATSVWSPVGHSSHVLWLWASSFLSTVFGTEEPIDKYVLNDKGQGERKRRWRRARERDEMSGEKEKWRQTEDEGER